MEDIFLIDFDITVTKKDTTHALLQKYNPELEKELKEKYKNNEITMREFVKIGLESLNITREEYIKTLQENVDIDETFLEFVKTGLEFKIVTAGTRLNVQGTLEKYGLNLPSDMIISNDISFEMGEDGKKDKITITNPFLDEAQYYGVDKREAVMNYLRKGYRVFFLGDGPSDYKAISVADFNFIRKDTRAIKYCVENGISFKEFNDFNEIIHFYKQSLKNIKVTIGQGVER